MVNRGLRAPFVDTLFKSIRGQKSVTAQFSSSFLPLIWPLCKFLRCAFAFLLKELYLMPAILEVLELDLRYRLNT